MINIIYIYKYLGLQKIKQIWSTPSVYFSGLYFEKMDVLVDISKNRVVHFMPSTATSNILSLPKPLLWLLEVGHGRSSELQMVSHKISDAPPHGDELQPSWPCFFQRLNSVRTMQKKGRTRNFPIFWGYLLSKTFKKQSDLVFGICRRLMVFVGVLTFFKEFWRFL